VHANVEANESCEPLAKGNVIAVRKAQSGKARQQLILMASGEQPSYSRVPPHIYHTPRVPIAALMYRRNSVRIFKADESPGRQLQNSKTKLLGACA